MEKIILETYELFDKMKDENYLCGYEREILDNIVKYEKCYLYGSSIFNDDIIQYLYDKGVTISGFCDDNKKLKYSGQYKIFQPEEFIGFEKEYAFIINSGFFYSQILERCKKLGFFYVFNFSARFYNSFSIYSRKEILINLNQIISVLELLDEKSQNVYLNVIKSKLTLDNKYIMSIRSFNRQYFDNDIISLSNEEVFIDVGAFDGKDSIDFSEIVKTYKKIYMFELDSENYFNIVSMINMKNEKIIIENLGLFDRKMDVFIKKSGSNATISKDGNSASRVIRLDDYKWKTEKPTFIKMDIEGAELNALKGAEGIIKENKPKMAICIYHKASHLWEIPLYLKNIVPEYRFSIGHYSSSELETVLYAY